MVINREAVDAPSPWNEVGYVVCNPAQSDRKRHAHTERKRRDKKNGYYDLDTVGEPHQLLKKNRQQNHIQEGDGCYTGDRNAHGKNGTNKFGIDFQGRKASRQCRDWESGPVARQYSINRIIVRNSWSSLRRTNATGPGKNALNG